MRQKGLLAPAKQDGAREENSNKKGGWAVHFSGSICLYNHPEQLFMN
jgi:hypothetical protein